ncbi:hypothetical protein BELL_0283g00080 [Botrytis elliptica]|uniref:F-box domain-containing protein n=1 Tax=Botrytis elliptica TaxID=278938 RepID=A0A4Z1JZA5_9HELO|nr:hypothetical protein EAE99_001996 [Botrytis elliptica]TGO74433.1 hypothetical protein BELL_0283g00080 [Botrytis elliptica]
MASTMDALRDPEKDCPTYDPTHVEGQQTAIYVQLVLSLTLGVSAFLGFCILRPKWKSLYAARKRHVDAAANLPELPDTFFGWIPILYRVTEEQVLASAGLDAYVFLSFFKMSMKLFGVMFIMAAAILAPINQHYYYVFDPFGNTTSPPDIPDYSKLEGWHGGWDGALTLEVPKDSDDKLPDTNYLWSYLVFTYVFTGLAIFFMNRQTHRVIRVRQDYLGSQSTITDRTIKLSGIPEDLRSEEKITEFLEKLQIGKVESVTLCRNWKKLDDMMDKRVQVVRRLEEAWTVHLGQQQRPSVGPIRTQSSAPDANAEDGSLSHEGDNLLGSDHITSYDQPRPTTRIWYGFLNFQSRKVDAIDHYEEQLRRLDDMINDARKKEYSPTALAFVTMDSIPACQMAVQALLDPTPMQLMARPAPAPSDIVWTNTYLPRSNRMIRSWAITIFILILTIFWLIPVAALAGLVSLCSIRQVWPGLADVLESHDILKALVQTGLPTLVVSLLNLAIPFLYDYLANRQGSISQGEVELSVISKNFYFTFFNVFLVFTVFGAASKFWPVLQETLKDTTKIAYTLAQSISDLSMFYTNFILLQALGLLPFRLLEFGSVSLYPITLMGAKTPRDYAELVQPPIFSYGFYLPSALLIYILCMVYSIQPAGYLVLLFGMAYFALGYYTYKYQLLYAMDHPQHATGGAWPMIVYRLLVGLGFFQLTMAGVIALRKAFTPAILVVPLIPFTIWYSYYFRRTFQPFIKFIALRSIRRDSDPDINIAGENIGIDRPPGHIQRRGSTVDEAREKGMRYINPSLVVPLEKIWINKDPDSEPNGSTPQLNREESAASSLSLGDTHIWREVGDENPGAVDTTSSQILLSRAIADHTSTSCPPVVRKIYSSIAVTSLYESPTRHIMTVGDAASTSKDVGLDGERMEQCNDSPSRRRSSALGVNEASVSHSLSDLITSVDDTIVDPQFPYNPWELSQLDAVPQNQEKRDKGKGVERGRTLERVPRYCNPLEKAESRLGRNKTTIEVDGRPIRRRDRSHTLHDDPDDPAAILDDQVLEPLRGISQQDSFSEVLSGHTSPSSLNGSLEAKELKSRLRSRTSGGSSISSTISPIEPLTRTVTKVYSASSPVSPEPTLPVESYSNRLPSIVRLEESARQSTSFTFSKLPTEIIQQVYNYLTPADFNSARHTCRAWLLTSMDRSLLENMIRRGGWVTSCQQEISDRKSSTFRRSSEYEWFMSKRISRECALGPDWTGSGVPVSPDHFPLESKDSPFLQASTVDFTEVAVQYKETTPAGTIFTVSSCGKFLMAANGCLVYIYELNKSHRDVDNWYEVQAGSLRPVTSIICPHRVLACSMDTSSHRYAIAVLLDGRMGLVCDISLSNIAPPVSSNPETSDLSSPHSSRSDLSLSPANDFHHGVSFLDRVSLDSSAPVQRAGRSTTSFVFPGIATTRSDGTSSGIAQRSEYHEGLRSASAVRDSYPREGNSPHSVGAGSRLRSKLPARRVSNADAREMPVETGPRSIYRNLCSEEDPPRSVAICPQRRCVAFGCSAGIELHWVDALTGQDLNRWFPLTAPSDFLFFLPPRKSIDSAKKLRLISSAARPSECTAVHERSYGRRPRGASFWQRIGWSGSHGDNGEEIEHTQQVLTPVGRFRSDSGRRVDHSDHYRAIPLSDGYHILFTDPSTGALCLGSDAPVGGPTKLLRKVWFQGPEGKGSPTVYAGGSDLSWGVRVVAAFGSWAEQSIWMFSVPGDVFHSSQNVLESSVTHKRNTPKNSKNMQWLDWWPDEGLQEWLNLIRHPVPGILAGNMWPVRIRGQRIGTCSGIVDLAIDSTNGITVWAFSTDGIAKVWRLDDGKHRDFTKLSVSRDGTIRENVPDDYANGEMNSDFLSSEILQHRSPLEQQSFDGAMSPDLDGKISPDISTIITARRGSGWSYQSVNYDEDGDVVMEDVYGPGVDMPAAWSKPEREYDEDEPLQNQQYQYLQSRWPRSSIGYRRWLERAVASGDLARVVEARGVSRIEIEIR